MMRKHNIWDRLAWIVLFLILIWLILKVMGVINTPLWLEYSPIFGAVYLAGWAISKLDSTNEDVKQVKGQIAGINKDIANIHTELGRIKTIIKC